jgi:NAD(P)-dependent dehydrogenase (short-subunit alcohol dehydrogenase family)
VDEVSVRTAVVCGGASGIGAVIADHLAQRGMQVVVMDRAQSERHPTYSCDLTDWSDCRLAFSQAAADLGRVHALVNSTRIREVPQQGADGMPAISALMKREFDSFLYPLELACEHMASHGQGSIVQLSSILADQVAVDVPLNYHCAKAAIRQLTRYYCCKYGPAGVRVNSVSPGLISRLSREHACWTESASKYQNLANSLPVQTSGSPLDVARVVEFLLGEGAFFVNGEDISVDGGQRVQELLSVVGR